MPSSDEMNFSSLNAFIFWLPILGIINKTSFNIPVFFLNCSIFFPLFFLGIFDLVLKTSKIHVVWFGLVISVSLGATICRPMAGGSNPEKKRDWKVKWGKNPRLTPGDVGKN